MTDFNPNALLANIENCKVNITVFEDAIEKENQTIRELRHMISEVERKEAEKKEALSRVHIEIG